MCIRESSKTVAYHPSVRGWMLTITDLVIKIEVRVRKRREKYRVAIALGRIRINTENGGQQEQTG